MQKNKILGILLLILTLITAGILLRQKEKGSSPGITTGDRDLGYSNIDEVETLVLKRKEYPLQVFKRKGSGWVLNEKDDVNMAVFNNLLAVIKNIKIMYIPTQAATQVIYKDLEKNGIQIQLFNKKGDKLRSYTVGTETGDGAGTPMMVDGAKQPYVMYLPGLEGSVRRRMIYDGNEWKNKVVFEEKAEHITMMEIKYPKDQNSSFRIDKKGNTYVVTNPDKTNEGNAKPTNQKTVLAYLDQLKYVEGEYNDENNPKKGLITSTSPFCFITIQYDNGAEKKMTFYSYMDISQNIVTSSPNQINEDNKFFITTSDNKFLLAQYRVLKNALKANLFFY